MIWNCLIDESSFMIHLNFFWVSNRCLSQDLVDKRHDFVTESPLVRGLFLFKMKND